MRSHFMNQVSFQRFNSRQKFLFSQRSRHRREKSVNRVVVPKTVEFFLVNSAPPRWFIAQFECKCVSAFVSQRRFVFVWIYASAVLIEVCRAYLKRLMNVADIMSQQNKRDRLGD